MGTANQYTCVMTRYLALLRAVNVGGTAKLPMAELREICSAAGLAQVKTYIQSGNVAFDSARDEGSLKTELQERLAQHLGKPVGVLIRTAAEMSSVLAAAPFTSSDPKQVYALFLDAPAEPNPERRAKGLQNEQMRLGAREIYIHYPAGQGRSKLKLPEMSVGTMRNMNTVAKLATL